MTYPPKRRIRDPKDRSAGFQLGSHFERFEWCQPLGWHRPRFPAAQTQVKGLSELTRRIRRGT